MPRSDPIFFRPLLWVAVCYIVGIVLGRLYLIGFLNTIWLTGVLLLLGLGAILRKWLSVYIVVLLVAVLFAGGASFYLAVSLPPGGLLEYADCFVTVEGTVVEEPLHLSDHSAYRLRVEAVETKEGRFLVPGTLLVKIYGAEEEGYWFGERLRLRATIIEPKGQRNPGGFDYRFYLRSQGVDALAYPKPFQVSSFGPGDPGRLAASALALRTRMAAGIEANLPSPAAELLTAVLFGQRHRLPEEIRDNFTRSGAGHLMAVSGLHVGLVAAIILGLWRRLGLRGGLPLVIAILLICGYAYLTGMRPSAVRAAVMLSLALGALLMDRERDIPTAVALAALATLAVNPLLLFTVGFQLSYAATLAILYLTPPLQTALFRLRVPAALRALIAVTLAAQLGVLPLCAYHFEHVPLAALLFNLLLLPLMAPLIGLGLTGALLHLLIPALAAPLLWAARPLLELMLFLTGLARYPGVYQPVYPPTPAALALIYALPVLALVLYHRLKDRVSISARLPDNRIPAGRPGTGSPLKLPFRPPLLLAVALLLALLLVWSGILFPASSDLTVTFIDVGQGAAALVQTPCGAAILLDGGGTPAYQGDPGEVGERILLPFLRRQGIRHLDLVVVSHPHEDHFGGLLPLLGEIPVSRLLISPIPGESPYYLELIATAEELKIPTDEGYAGQRWACGPNLILEILHPPQKLLRGAGSTLNNNSLVIRLTYGSVRILFTGDIEQEAVRDLLRRKEALQAEILQIPHHGGYLANLPDFLIAVKPQAAVIPVGINPFGHPHPFILTSLEEAGVTVYRTDLHGAVIVETNGTEFKIKTMQ